MNPPIWYYCLIMLGSLCKYILSESYSHPNHLPLQIWSSSMWPLDSPGYTDFLCISSIPPQATLIHQRYSLSSLPQPTGPVWQPPSPCLHIWTPSASQSQSQPPTHLAETSPRRARFSTSSTARCHLGRPWTASVGRSSLRSHFDVTRRWEAESNRSHWCPHCA